MHDIYDFKVGFFVKPAEAEDNTNWWMYFTFRRGGGGGVDVV